MPLIEKLASKLSSKESESKNVRLTPSKDRASPPPPFTRIASSSSDQPPTYTAQDSNTNAPSASDLSAAFSSLNLSTNPSPLPTPETCLAHLKLLHTLQTLKQDIGYTDGLFGVWDAKAERAEKRDETLSKLREKRWVLFIARAVERFQAWWTGFLCPLNNSKRLECKEIDPSNMRFVKFPERGAPITWTGEMLPPLGILITFQNE
jgi:hypothetical protein